MVWVSCVIHSLVVLWACDRAVTSSSLGCRRDAHAADDGMSMRGGAVFPHEINFRRGQNRSSGLRSRRGCAPGSRFRRCGRGRAEKLKLGKQKAKIFPRMRFTSPRHPNDPIMRALTPLGRRSSTGSGQHNAVFLIGAVKRCATGARSSRWLARPACPTSRPPHKPQRWYSATLSN